MKTRLLFLPLFLFACSTPDGAGSQPPSPAPETTATIPSALEGAHESYLRGDWLTMLDRLHDVLVDRATTASVRENAFELLDKAYEATSGKLPSRFEYPRGFQHIKLGSTRRQHPWANSRGVHIYIRLDKGLGAHVKDISLRTQPGNEPVLDRAANIGTTNVFSRTDADEVVIEMFNAPGGLPDGVASLRVALDDGRAVDTWIIARGLLSSASPEIATPPQAATFADPNPTLEWVPFRSPEYAPFEDRTLSVWVTKEKADSAVFDRWVFQPGDLAKMKIEPKLEPGPYWFALTEGEERSFGPIRITRSSQRGVQFSVVAP